MNKYHPFILIFSLSLNFDNSNTNIDFFYNCLLCCSKLTL